MINYLSIGIILGLSAGFAPGPLLALVIAETLQHNIRSGIKVALAPILTDLPIILVTWAVLAQLSGFHYVLGLLSLGGGAFLLLLGYQNLHVSGLELNLRHVRTNSLMKGILVNFLSPHPYLFWVGVGVPTATRAMSRGGLLSVFAFISGFYLCLVGAKVLLAVLTGQSRSFLTGPAYRAIMRCLGLLLIVLAVWLIFDGLKLLQLLA